MKNTRKMKQLIATFTMICILFLNGSCQKKVEDTQGNDCSLVCQNKGLQLNPQHNYTSTGKLNGTGGCECQDNGLLNPVVTPPVVTPVTPSDNTFDGSIGTLYLMNDISKAGPDFIDLVRNSDWSPMAHDGIWDTYFGRPNDPDRDWQWTLVAEYMGPSTYPVLCSDGVTRTVPMFVYGGLMMCRGEIPTLGIMQNPLASGKSLPYAMILERNAAFPTQPQNSVKQLKVVPLSIPYETALWPVGGKGGRTTNYFVPKGTGL